MNGERSAARARPESTGRWAVMLVMSAGLHLAGFGLAAALPRILFHGPNGPPVYMVDLVSLPAAGPPAPPPAGHPAPAKREIARPPKPEATIKLPDRNVKKLESKKKPVEPKPAPTPAPRTPQPREATATGAVEQPTPGAARGGTIGTAGVGAPSGGGGGGTGPGGGQADFYYSYLHGRIESAWQKPIYPPKETTRRVLTATVRLTLSSSGRVIRLDLVASSGYEALDQSVLRAVQDAQPFQPIPASLGGDSLTVNLAFDLTPD